MRDSDRTEQRFVEAFERGRRARARGVERDACPYVEGRRGFNLGTAARPRWVYSLPELADGWLAGWEDA